MLFLIFLSTAHVEALPSGFKRYLIEDGLTQPTSMTWRPGGVHLYVTEKTGNLRVIKNGALQSTPVYSFSVNTASERGLLGAAVDPDFLNNRYLYVYYTRSAAPVKNRVSRITVDSNFNVGVPGSEVVLLDNIPSDAGNHNAGSLHFSKSGKLLIGTGDGGSTPANSQDLTNLAGKLLRVNKDGTVPSDNPFYGQAGVPERKYGPMACVIPLRLRSRALLVLCLSMMSAQAQPKRSIKEKPEVISVGQRVKEYAVTRVLSTLSISTAMVSGGLLQVDLFTKEKCSLAIIGTIITFLTTLGVG